MRNNGLVFLGFVIICLVNLGASRHQVTAPAASAPVPNADLQMATLPATDPIQPVPADKK